MRNEQLRIINKKHTENPKGIVDETNHEEEDPFSPNPAELAKKYNNGEYPHQVNENNASRILPDFSQMEKLDSYNRRADKVSKAKEKYLTDEEEFLRVNKLFNGHTVDIEFVLIHDKNKDPEIQKVIVDYVIMASINILGKYENGEEREKERLKEFERLLRLNGYAFNDVLRKVRKK